ncbi:MAG: FMN-binding negative transcriptional regulator [Sphingopyxis sp.]|jgi:transcriptional regulator|uniref:FMN-binding negative transcriptional regulator n=1 Tax=Sphingopyxis sp. TaxID=1908224 RepID=UPI001A482FB7|nr:FMN-binding negative transcriptional regulator [Sphingopyxis sp.]MBL9068854.1 FMN-binding negative transcriptional regulator [Sphingopyxis sp.]
MAVLVGVAMFLAEWLREERTRVLIDFMRAHSFAALAGGDELAMSHVPLLVEEGVAGLRLHGHFARANPHWRHLRDGAEVLAAFMGPNAYVSPRCYRAPDVPTWNYGVVQARGRWRREADEEAIGRHLEAIVDHYESFEPVPWSLAEIDPAIPAAFRKGVIVFSIEVTELKGALKLSQDKDVAQQAGVADFLHERGRPADIALAELMRNSMGDVKND